MLSKSIDKRKKVFFMGINFILICYVMSILLVHGVVAHSAEKLDIEYNFDEQVLSVTITHNTNDVDKHYISNLKVYKNGVLFIENNYSSQPSKDIFNLVFDVDAKEGDMIKVEIGCNVGGKVEKSLTVTVDGGSSDGSQTPGFKWVSIFVGVLIVVFFIRRKRMRNL